MKPYDRIKELQVRERFWRHHAFPGWKSFLLQYFDAQKTAWSPTDLAAQFCEKFPDEGFRVVSNIASTCSILENDEEILSIKVDGRNYYGRPDIFKSEEGNKKMIESIKLRPKPKAFSVPSTKKEHGFSKINANRSIEDKKTLMKPEHKTPNQILSRAEHNQKRVDDLRAAIAQRVLDEKTIPIDWVDEYNELSIKLKRI
ncbi:hypothetical protein MUK70_11595 [Dyadobacter chenwenxiniae]|uniref:Uncharacterized protein n=1 Tax=Dyadobacter chenwenxiniae TaxID=2906456 RepID=A0A9X1PI39_9BACT|nr:hypothetical protein [Dyadobacter chenwenxiniae]MCF0059883.1 hypothetical protein [Dyadobacter chenwenxiniae]UON85623.1 hypothetical protein MUK70_11595 [Dyadobacter chenwenxiniae]